MNNDRLEKLKTLLGVVNESITKQEFVTSFKAVLDFVKQIDAKNTAEFDNIKVQFKHLANTLKTDNESELDQLKALVNSTMKDAMAEMMVECDAKMQQMDMKMSAMRDGIDGLDGKDADEKKVMEMVLAKIPPAEPNEPLDIVDKLESLKGDYRLDASAIKNLPEPKGGRWGGGLSRGVADTLYAPLGTTGGVDTANSPLAGEFARFTDEDTIEGLTAAETRTALGLVIGTNVQAYDADLTTWAGLTPSANAQSLVTAANYAAMRTLLDLEAGTDFYSITAADAAFQPKDTQLTDLAGLSYAGNALKVIRVNAGENGVELAAVAGGSGITRTVVTTSGSATMGSTASTDYTYYVAGLHTMSLPSPNTNRYTVKNLHSAAITIDTAGAENIEGAANISLEPNDSVDIMSDGTNWYVH